MSQELKIRITNLPEIEQNLQKIGATLTEEVNFSDTYFNQSAGEVLKLSDTDNGFFFQSLKAEPDGKFTLIKSNQVEHADQVKAEMTNEYGIKCILKGKRRTYSFGENKIVLSLIDGLGNFLILIGENPTEDFFTSKMGIQNPEYIKVSFDTLQPTVTGPTA